jgi:lambda repressor-like predicted transcriptional regulator
MPQGDKSSYTDKQKRQAAHIIAGYKKKGMSMTNAEERAWATVNKITGGGRKNSFGRRKA